MHTMTLEMARRIEREAGLSLGSIATGRNLSTAEETYFEMPLHPHLAIHVEGGGSNPTLLLYEQEVGIRKKKYLEGAAHATWEEANDEADELWRGLSLARQSNLLSAIGEDLSVTFTGWDGENDRNGKRWSWSVMPSRICGIFSRTPTSMLLLPHFEDWPPKPGGNHPPGKFISRLGVQQVLYVHSIDFMGLTTLKNWSSREVLKRRAKQVTLMQ